MCIRGENVSRSSERGSSTLSVRPLSQISSVYLKSEGSLLRI